MGISERLTQCERLKMKLERSVQSHMEREQKLLTTHEIDMAQAAQLNERLRTQLEEREAELTHHRDDLKKKVFVLKLVSENIFLFIAIL